MSFCPQCGRALKYEPHHPNCPENNDDDYTANRILARRWHTPRAQSDSRRTDTRRSLESMDSNSEDA